MFGGARKRLASVFLPSSVLGGGRGVNYVAGIGGMEREKVGWHPPHDPLAFRGLVRLSVQCPT